MEEAPHGMEIITRYFGAFTPEQLEQLNALEALYGHWNAQINVISRKDIGSLYEKHVLHSLSIAAVFDFRSGSRVIDIGTGGGFPGIPLAIGFLIFAAALIFATPCRAQLSYVAHFTLEKEKFLLGEPIFCNFVIHNTGARTFSFRYRSPDRVQTRDLEGEPHFRVAGASHRPLPDPAPHPCGGAKGSVVYGSVTLPPGQVHTERWLLNQWARFSRRRSARTPN